MSSGKYSVHVQDENKLTIHAIGKSRSSGQLLIYIQLHYITQEQIKDNQWIANRLVHK